jgi:prolyl-tRNA synthetase
MRLTGLFGQTLREMPADAEVASHQLLIRAGYIRQSGAGIFSNLHLAHRSMQKIEQIMREEMESIGGQELLMPVVQPAEIWKETGRWHQIGTEMGRFKDKNGRDMVLAMTHEELVADLVRREIHSYKQLPQLIYHIQTKWRDDPRPRAGLIRVREFAMKDSYSLDADWEGLDQQYRNHYQAYFKIYLRCGLQVVAVRSDVGMMGGQMAHEFMYLTPAGEDTIMTCNQCGYTANRQIAMFQKDATAKDTELRPLEKVATPDTSSIEDLAQFLNVPESRTAKAVFLNATVLEQNKDIERLVFAVVRGDMEVNETKLGNAIGAKKFRPAVDDDILAVGAIPGYASPIGVSGALVVVDDLVPGCANLVAGANEEGYHLKNVNYGRDFKADMILDIALAYDGALCPECSGSLEAVRGVEVGNIFKLGTHYSEAMGCFFNDQNGKQQPVIMGSYGIGVGRLLACVAEEYHDSDGLCLPVTIAPYQVHLTRLRGGEEVADQLYSSLQEAGIEVLYDDRDESPGVKFNDADLIGLPIRVTISKRTVKEDSAEIKLRHENERFTVPLSVAVNKISEILSELGNKVLANVVKVELLEEKDN